MHYQYKKDRNTTYFHGLAAARRRHNRIVMLKDDQGNWVEDLQLLKNMGVDFYSRLYLADIGCKKFLISGMFPRLAEEDIVLLSAEFSDQEISTALFSMGGWKAPGRDGLSAMFFQSNWTHVKNSILEWVKEIFRNPSGIKNINHTFLSLIPK